MTVEQLLAAIIGPVGALALALVGLYIVGRVVATLWSDHLRADADDRAQRDQAFAVGHAQVEATKAVADSYATIAKSVEQIAREVAAIRRDMATRRKNDP